jgi:YD repeat-containing protein
LDRRTTRGVPSPRNINASQYIESHRSVGTTSPAHPCPARLGVKPWEGGSLCTGNLSLTFAVGPVSLIYNSMDAASAGPGGFGMRLGFRDRITPNADGSVTRVMASGEPVVFTPDGQGGFRSPPETDDTMTRPSADRYVLKVRGGTKMTYRNPNGSAWLLGSIADRVGNTTIIAVDAANRETSVTDPVGNVTRLAWSQGRIASVTNAEGLIWTLQYTGGELTGIRHPAVNGTAPVETLAYDGGGRHLLLTHTSPEGVAVARFEYNADGSLAASLDPEGRRTTLTSTASQVRITDAFGNITTYNFTSAGELGETYDPSGVRMARNVYDSRAASRRRQHRACGAADRDRPRPSVADRQASQAELSAVAPDLGQVVVGERERRDSAMVTATYVGARRPSYIPRGLDQLRDAGVAGDCPRHRQHRLHLDPHVAPP